MKKNGEEMATVKNLLFVFWGVLLVCILNSYQCQAQSDTTHINKPRVRLVAVGIASAYTVSMIGLSQVWYSQYAHQSFRFFNDLPEWKQMDKCGHFFSSFQLAGIGSHSFRWGNMPATKADKIGALTSMLVMSSIEVFDGFSAAYGASATDLLANATGNAFYLGQSLAWNEIRIYPKFSFHTTSLAAVNRNELGSDFSQELIKDYNGQTYWLSVDMDKFIKFPKWLNFCVGYGAQNMVNAHDDQSIAKGYTPYRQYYVGIDFDLSGYKSRSKIVNTLIYFVNMIRIPAPAIEFSKGKVRGHGLYF